MSLIQCTCEPGTGGTITRIPDAIFAQTGRENQSVTIDACIFRVIEHLWDEGIVTLGCCCGHNKAAPSIVIRQSYTDLKIAEIKDIIYRIDVRRWEIQQWRLVSV